MTSGVPDRSPCQIHQGLDASRVYPEGRGAGSATIACFAISRGVDRSKREVSHNPWGARVALVPGGRDQDTIRDAVGGDRRGHPQAAPVDPQPAPDRIPGGDRPGDEKPEGLRGHDGGKRIGAWGTPRRRSVWLVRHRGGFHAGTLPGAGGPRERVPRSPVYPPPDVPSSARIASKLWLPGGRRPGASRLRSRSAPYQRLVAQSALSPAAQVPLHGQYEALNPLQLRRQIDSTLTKLWPLGRT